MKNWAIVIGINEYKKVNNLDLAVKDAQDVTQWLIQNGDVKPHRLFLLTSPDIQTYSDEENPLEEAINKRPATFEDLRETLNNLRDDSGNVGDRLYFYFSGHGFINKQNFEVEDGLMMSDFDSKDKTDASMMLSSLMEYFKTKQFKEQFFIIDACRNATPQYGNIRLGEAPVGGQTTGEFTPSQFVLFATAPHLRAAERKSEKNGIFTKALLDGLNGKGTAKIYNYEKGIYEIPIHKLFNYIQTRIENQKIKVTRPGEETRFQQPRGTIDYNGNFPILKTYSKEDKTIKEVLLEISVKPKEALSEIEFSIRTADDSYDIKIPNTKAEEPVFSPTQSPFTPPPKILPMLYTLKVFSKTYEIKKQPNAEETPKSKWTFDLYEPKHIEIELSPRDEILEIDAPWDSIDEPHSPSNLTLITKDPLAPLEIRDNTDKIIKFGQGELTKENVGGTIENSKPPQVGFYYARLIQPENIISEEITSLEGQDETISLNVLNSSLKILNTNESSIFNKVLKQTNLRLSKNNGLSISPDLDPIATAQTSTILTLAGSVANQRFRWSENFEGLNLKSFQEVISSQKIPSEKTNSGIRITIAEENIDDHSANKYFSQVEFELRKQSGELIDQPFVTEISKVSGIAQYTACVVSGNYILSIKFPNRKKVLFAVSVLDNHMALMVFHRQLNGEFNAFVFSPSTQTESDFETQKEILNDLRRMELLQRFYINNWIDKTHAYKYASDLLKKEKLNPYAGILGGYTLLSLLKFNKSVQEPTEKQLMDELEYLTSKLTESYGEISDSYVLAGEYLEYQEKSNKELKKEKYKKALEIGIPIFSEGVEKLLRSAKEYNIKHNNLNKLKIIADNSIKKLLTSWAVPSK